MGPAISDHPIIHSNVQYYGQKFLHRLKLMLIEADAYTDVAKIMSAIVMI
jgi:hypothetical protein